MRSTVTRFPIFPYETTINRISSATAPTIQNASQLVIAASGNIYNADSKSLSIFENVFEPGQE